MDIIINKLTNKSAARAASVLYFLAFVINPVASSAAIDNRICISATPTIGSTTGRSQIITLRVIKTVGDVSSVVGENCHTDNFDNGSFHCHSQYGAMTVDVNGDLRISMSLSEKDAEKPFMLHSGSTIYVINPSTLKGEVDGILEFSINGDESIDSFIFPAEVIACPTSDKSRIRLLKKFIKDADRL